MMNRDLGEYLLFGDLITVRVIRADGKHVLTLKLPEVNHHSFEIISTRSS